ncbi:hypothetical protein MPNT_30125 [Candidatus Methylacidithermus pantelleriae]|uniref:Uncharacterized protein n=1 Tax=Candidatus Methylacidithermus pantelleriae TaxID=2744239 RepID=A0A8J2BK74_9BACT|nr:hypothetical protein MPNT_30125 [Candidatus Methylacidithermus pantelleriae]
MWAQSGRCWLEEGLADVEGGAFGCCGRGVVGREGNRAWGGRQNPMGWSSRGGCAGADEPVD